MQLVCPQCGRAIPAAAVNVASDLAKCEACNELFRASELIADVDLRAHLSPPPGSRITFTSDGQTSATIEIPATGLKARHVPLFIFATIWLGFVALWTVFAAFLAAWGGAGVIPVLFSIPFWLVGLGLWTGLINTLRERQRIELTTQELVFHKLRPLLSRRVAIAYEQIEKIGMESLMTTDAVTMARYIGASLQANRGWEGLVMPCVVHGTQKTFFAQTLSEVEREWLNKVLQGVVYKLCGRKV